MEITRKRDNRNTNAREMEEAEDLYKKAYKRIEKKVLPGTTERPRKRHMGLQNRYGTAPIICAVLLDQTIKSKRRNRTFSMRNQYKRQDRGRDRPYDRRGENMLRDTEEQEGA
ncbi:hypothetical protein JTB14_014453 [Gonioctena quinquepunctata]|nr:hypothetical protein JTB14_014453 [Gonioctena quinquepunctata]